MPTYKGLAEKAAENIAALQANVYPGRGIVMGRTATDNLVQIYWVMGRREGSRNRILAEEDGMVKTEPFDESKVTGDLSLLKYNAMREFRRKHERFYIVSNGDQTDTVVDSLQAGHTVADALNSREFEPDPPIYTPRITGVITGPEWDYTMWTTYRDRKGNPKHSPFSAHFVVKGSGVCIHTYKSNGDPPPPFEGIPYIVPIGADIDEIAETYWDTLNNDNRVALAAKSIEVSTGETSLRIINKLQ